MCAPPSRPKAGSTPGGWRSSRAGRSRSAWCAARRSSACRATLWRRAAFGYRKKPGRREYVRVKLEPVPGDLPVARRAGSEGAGVLSSLVAADGLVELADDALGLSEGDTAAYLPFSEVMR